jgi:hydroxymethylpyrimidine/phosphomethylpyrimidine kinase
MQYLLSIAGHDPTSGAGVIRDILTFRKFGFYGMGVITAITYQNTEGFQGLNILKVEEVKKQIDALVETFNIKYVKVGLVGSREIADLIVDMANKNEWFVIFDPLLGAKNGYPLNSREDVESLLKRANIITPNIPEAEELSGLHIEEPSDVIKVGYTLRDMYGNYVVIKGGHLNGTDYLFGEFMHSTSLPLLKKNMHGTGCVYSSALLGGIASGKSVKEAFDMTRKFLQNEIKNSIETGGYALPP